MCDNWVALRDSTPAGQVIFAKNSDRPIFDCQPLVYQPRRSWGASGSIQLEYVQLPQVKETYAHLGARPYWCWGYELGLNEHGLAIGNEAIFTRSFRQAASAWQSGAGPEPGLLGMDLIRLALERCQNARQAVFLIGELVKQYGQFGSALPSHDHAAGGYDNAFLIADPDEAWVLEAVGHRWVAQRISTGYASISNQPTIQVHRDAGSPDLLDYAIAQGWWPDDQRTHFDFARAYVDENTPRHLSYLRQRRTQQLLAEKAGQVTPAWMMRIARDHYEDSFLGGPVFDAGDPDFLTVCMHASPADFTWGNTASSCVAVLPANPHEIPVLWWTPGPPCNGCYVPFFPHGSRLPEAVSTAGLAGLSVTPPAEAAPDQYSPGSYWWRFRELLDRVKGAAVGSLPGCYTERNRRVRARFDALEGEFASSLPDVLRQATQARQAGESADPAVLDAFTDGCVQAVEQALQELIAEFPPVERANIDKKDNL
jgi:secernin